MKPTRMVLLLAAALAIVPSAGRLHAQQSDPCGGDTHCKAVTSFVARVSDFRNSTNGRTRIVTATVRFQNRTNHPLTLAYVQNSGIVTDDQGNRYVVYGDNSVRGIGLVKSNTFDPKFTLQAGESSDARFEFVWSPNRNDIFGTKFEVELSVREIEPLAGNQYRLGREHALRFAGFGDVTIAAAGGETSVSGSAQTAAAPTEVAAQAAAPAAVPPMANPCGDAPHCYGAGPFVAQVARVTGSRGANNTGDHMLQVVLRIRNVSTTPIVLGYKGATSIVIDNYGNRYYWGRAGTHDQSASGIGMVTSRSADPQFTLSPGESRDATFQLRRYGTGRNAIGSAFNYSVALVQLEILPGNQVRSVREFSLTFDDLASDAPSAGAQQVNDEVGKLGAKLIDRLKGKPKKP